MTTLQDLRARGCYYIPQDQGELEIIWQVRPLDPAALFAADAIISAFFELHAATQKTDKPGALSEIEEAERLARSAGQTTIEARRDQLTAQQEIARACIVAMSTDRGETYRSVRWVADQADEEDIEDGPLHLHIGWVSQAALTAMVWKGATRLKEETGRRFPGRSEE